MVIRIKKMLSVFIAVTILSISFIGFFQPVLAQEATPTPTPDSSSSTSSQVADLQKQIQDLQNKISSTQSQEKTLSSQISAMDNQIKLTELRIASTNEQISELTDNINTTSTKIATIEGSLSGLTKVLLDHIVATYKVGANQDFGILLTSNSISDFFKRESYLKIVQAHDKQLIYDTVQAKNDYANQQTIFEDQKKKVEALQSQLQAYNDQLDQEKSDKQKLLAETQGDEATYQRLLAQTEAQLASFSNFVTVQGGASLLSNQTVCDDWGCYYNQRDSQWGSIALNGTPYSIASDGCLMTSMAMVYTHYGHKDVNPLSINSVSSNFSGIPPALLKYSIAANGVSSQRVSADIDATLAGGNPVIVGISYDGGPYPDHFVVFVSGSGGNYVMNDPFTPNGHNISFRGRYPTVRIVEEDKVQF
jgi:peptidoglycan hydrolase CwlO-like protein